MGALVGKCEVVRLAIVVREWDGCFHSWHMCCKKADILHRKTTKPASPGSCSVGLEGEVQEKSHLVRKNVQLTKTYLCLFLFPSVCQAQKSHSLQTLHSCHWILLEHSLKYSVLLKDKSYFVQYLLVPQRRHSPSGYLKNRPQLRVEWGKPSDFYITTPERAWVCVLPQWEGWGRLCASLGSNCACFGQGGPGKKLE